MGANHQKTVFTITIFLSAFLLFLIQPMVGKIILPVLGGTPSVWNTAMVFFQMLLLGGYLYAHLLGKFKSVGSQLFVHTTLLVLAFASLFMNATTDLQPDDASPLLWQMTTMALIIGLPFFALSASAPLLQKWFSLTSHPNAANPYFLYSASNIGSVLALLLYPVIIERFLPLSDQMFAFHMGFGVLGALFILCGAPLRSANTLSNDIAADTTPPPNLKMIATWWLLSFVPSSMMLGFTSFVTTDIGSAPLFWVMPLTLYILSFVLAFADKKLFPLGAVKATYAILFLLLHVLLNMLLVNYKWEVAMVHAVFFFVTALMCHQQLNALKPSAKHLTLFFLIMSVGGACGGIFNALVAPLFFLKPYEYMIATALSLLCFAVGYKQKFLIASGLVLILIHPIVPWEDKDDKLVHLSRNYFGTLTVRDNGLIRSLAHGTTGHGSQVIDPAYKHIPTTYYHPLTAIGNSLAIAKSVKPALNVGGLGMGVGSIACLLRGTDHLTFVEIDPDIIKIAQDKNLFTYLSDCPPHIDIIQGDARLKIKDQPDATFDYILVDVFSSDNIPMHLMTQEAFAIYLSKLKPDGMLVIHISNRYMALAPEVTQIARSLNVTAYQKITVSGTDKDGNLPYLASEVMIITKDKTYDQKLIENGWLEFPKKLSALAPWTDTYANPLRALFAHKGYFQKSKD